MTDDSGDGIALISTSHPVKRFKKRYRRKLQTKTLEIVEIDLKREGSGLLNEKAKEGK